MYNRNLVRPSTEVKEEELFDDHSDIDNSLATLQMSCADLRYNWSDWTSSEYFRSKTSLVAEWGSLSPL